MNLTLFCTWLPLLPEESIRSNAGPADKTCNFPLHAFLMALLRNDRMTARQWRRDGKTWGITTKGLVGQQIRSFGKKGFLIWLQQKARWGSVWDTNILADSWKKKKTHIQLGGGGGGGQRVIVYQKSLQASTHGKIRKETEEDLANGTIVTEGPHCALVECLLDGVYMSWRQKKWARFFTPRRELGNKQPHWTSGAAGVAGSISNSLHCELLKS